MKKMRRGKLEKRVGRIADREKVVSPVARAMILGRRWLKKQEKIYPPQVVRILAELLNAHIKRLGRGGGEEEVRKIEDLVRRAELGGVNSEELTKILIAICDTVVPSIPSTSSRGYSRARGGMN